MDGNHFSFYFADFLKVQLKSGPRLNYSSYQMLAPLSSNATFDEMKLKSGAPDALILHHSHPHKGRHYIQY